uniref:Uncharacterized protein n=1 Tax=viral metagenome TaxID=1070528 RepID=A0A6C0DR27_9ZZZZ
MQTGNNSTVDANAAVPPEIQSDDPRHLKNLTAKMNSINAQTASDTKYDPAPPPRVDASGNPVREYFADSGAPIGLTETRLSDEYLYAVGAAAASVLVIIAVILADPALFKNIAKIEYSFPLLGGAAVLAVMTLVIVREAMKRNNYVRWHPNMRG